MQQLVQDKIAETKEFHLKEFQALRDEIMASFRELRFMERAAILGPVASYSWLATQSGSIKDPTMLVVAWWLPALLIWFLMRRYRVTYNEILRAAAYIRDMEKILSHPDLKGFGNLYKWDR
jgi:hypothetical protein